MDRRRGSHGPAAMAAAAAGLGLAACASGGPELAAGGRAQGLFRAPAPMAGSVAPSPRAGWYVSQTPPRYVRMGLAREHAGRGGLSAWVARLFGPRSQERPRAVIAETSGLPAPSVASVENVRTGAVVQVRVEERAALGDHLISLDEASARRLGKAPGEPLLVRVRYVAPAIAYRDGTTTLKLALLGRRGAETVLAEARTIPAGKAGPPSLSPRSAPGASGSPAAGAPSEPAQVVAARVEAPAQEPTTARPPPKPVLLAKSAAPTRLRVQAGTFANPKNAERAVAMLAPAGRAAVEPVQRNGTTLYRVYLSAPAGPAAEAMRARAAELGFKDARIMGAL